jgi:hypothetical protein
VEEEAAQELGGVKSHDALLAAMGIVLPAKADALSVEGQQAVIGNGDAMGVAARVAQTCAGPPKGGLAYTIHFFLRNWFNSSVNSSRS